LVAIDRVVRRAKQHALVPVELRRVALANGSQGAALKQKPSSEPGGFVVTYLWIRTDEFQLLSIGSPVALARARSASSPWV
jgi:hypothetical protein